jgi:putative DNA primase/helicase
MPKDKACEIFQPKHKPKNNEEPDMSEALELLNTHVYRCPTDTEEVLVYKDGIYEPAKPHVWNTLESEYGENLSKHFVGEAIAHLQRANTIDRSEINRYINKMPIQNGLFNLATREILPFNPDQVFTYKLNVEYNPEATCPKWLEFIRQIVAEDDIPLLQEIIGYCLLPSMPFHKLFWFYGTGRNGKGVVIRTLEAILGKGNVSNLNLSEFTEGRRFSLQKLYGKLLNVSSEPKLTKYGLQTTVLKMAVGQDTIDAEIKCKNERLKFINYAKLVVMGNHFPKVEDNSLGWWDRVIVLGFPHSFEGERCIPNIENRWIPEELSGIFNWMLDGLYRLYANNGFSTSKSTEETKTEFMKVSDAFNAWILERCVKVPNAYLTREEAQTAYFDYCDEIGADRDSKRVFYEKMRQTPKVKDAQKLIGGKAVRVFTGITLKTDEDSTQTSLNIADIADITVTHTAKVSNNSEKIWYINTANSAINAINDTFNIDSLFPKGQYPICWACHGSITQLENLTNVDGKPIHKSCKMLLNT